MPATAQMGARLKYNQNASVTGTASQLASSPSQGLSNTSRANAGVIVKSLPGNTQTVYVGGDSSVTSSNGYPLAAGDSVTLPVDDPSRIWVVAASGTQTLAWICI